MTSLHGTVKLNDLTETGLNRKANTGGIQTCQATATVREKTKTSYKENKGRDTQTIIVNQNECTSNKCR